MAFSALVTSSSSMSMFNCSTKTTISRPTIPITRTKTIKKQRQKQNPAGGGGGGALKNVGEVLKKDIGFIKKGIRKGMAWANEAFRIPQLTKAIDDVVWLRPLEDPCVETRVQSPSWPQPHYPELSGLDLFIADLKALEAYGNYFACLSKMWTKPLPETYDPEEVVDYFNLRPHLVAIRLLEVFAAFASAAIKFRISGVYSSVDEEARRNEFGIVLKETLLSLGPTFIKVGQSLSTRPDVIGSQISKALSELHDQIPPFPRAEAMKIIEEELGSPVERIFNYISEEPVAAASFGQVYRGITHDGSDVAVKVQRPNLYHVVVRDIYILRLGLGYLQKIAKRKSDLSLYADELGKGIVGELDYNLEAANATEFLEAHSSYSFIHVPKVYRHLSRKRVLTMEWVAGESPNDLMLLTEEAAGHDFGYQETHRNDAKRKLLDLVNKGVEATLVQLLETGILHADPHAGNLRYTSTGQIGFLDFGLLCRMERKHQLSMLACIVHIVNGDWGSLVHDLAAVDIVRPGTNLRRVTLDLEVDLGTVELKDGIPDVKFSRVLSKILSVAFKYHFRMPPYYTLLLRSLASFEGLAVAADPNFKTFEAAYPHVVRKLLIDNSVPMRRILHSAVLNRRKEFQWQKLAVFLRVGATRKRLHAMVASDTQISPENSKGTTQELDIANFILRLLPSKDGAVLRRLIITADGSSLIRAVISKEATSLREEACRLIADILYQWMCKSIGKVAPLQQTTCAMRLAGGNHNMDRASFTRVATPIYDYKSFLQDRRLRLIFSKILSSARKDPVLMIRFIWASIFMFIKASALASHRVLVSLSEAYLAGVSFGPKRIVVGA